LQIQREGRWCVVAVGVVGTAVVEVGVVGMAVVGVVGVLRTAVGVEVVALVIQQECSVAFQVQSTRM
jgi:hypothetical protein